MQAGSFALVEVKLSREIDFIGLPLEVELITNCVTGKPELLESLKVPAFANTSAALIPINQVGKDSQSCYLRSRVKVKTTSGISKMAYTNHIRFLMD